MSHINKQLALAFLNLAFANRTEEALRMMSDDASWWVAGSADRLKVAGNKNRMQIERLLKAVARAVPNGMRTLVHGVTAEDDRIAIEVEAEGIWSNGKPYHNRYHFLIRIREGLIQEVREYMDTLHLFDVLSDE